MRSPWNHNTWHHRAVLRSLPRGPGRVLDVGCGDGRFAGMLADAGWAVVALDVDPGQVTAARRRLTGTDAQVVLADFLDAGLPDASCTAVTALASWHHLPFDAAARAAARVLRPGGRLVVLGVWTDRRTPADLAWNLASTAVNLSVRVVRGPDRMAAPAMAPAMTLPDVRRAAAEHLPGSRVRRRLLWRYTLVWTRP